MSREDKNYASVMERERTGDPQSIASVLDPRELEPFLDAVDQYTPTIPEEVTGYYLQQAGMTIADPRIKKVVSLAAEKLISDIVHDSTTYSRMKEQGGEVLKMEDLVQSLKKYGIKKVPVGVAAAAAAAAEQEGDGVEDNGSVSAAAGGGGGAEEGGGRRTRGR